MVFSYGPQIIFINLIHQLLKLKHLKILGYHACVLSDGKKKTFMNDFWKS